MKNKTALITGIRGQDGSYLAEFLIAQGYHVFGTTHSEHIKKSELNIIKLDLNNFNEIKALIADLRPDELYNFAARSSSAQLFDDPIATGEINGMATVRFLEAIRQHSTNTRFCQAASSELFAGSNFSPQDENTPYCPINAYGAAKTFATNITASYRKSHNLFATTAILFNHESPRRGLDYVTRKITHTAAKISLGLASELILGNLDSKRDWGFAGDYVHAMWLMLQQPVAEDFVIATGSTHSVREFCEIAFSYLGLNYKQHVKTNPELARRVESVELCGNPNKANRILKWQPTVDFRELVCMMVDADLTNLKSNI